MSLGNKKTVEEVRICNETKVELFRIQLVEEILTDGSKVYNVETSFYENNLAPVLILEDASACDYNEAWKKFKAIKNSLSIFEESQVL